MDYLDEDDLISNQKFSVISYVIPKDSKNVMLKIRGSFSTIEDCNKRIQKLQKNDKYFHMYVAEVGKWGCLLDEEQLKNSDLDSVYREKEMNEFMKGYKEQKEKADLEFQQRKDDLTEKAKKDGTKEGQEILSKQRENPLSVIKRLKDSKTFIEQIENQLKECKEIYESANEKLKTYSEEEIEKAKKEIEN